MERPGSWTAAAAAVLLAALLPAAASSRLRPPPPMPIPMIVVLAGEINVGGQHSGMLELWLDDELYDAIPAGPGLFELMLPAGSGVDMVRLEYIAPGVRLRAFLGSQARLTQLAGSDARVIVEEEDGLRVSPLGTAIAVLASSVDGTPPASDAAFAAAVQAAWPSDIVTVATALERYAVEPGRLPAGYADGLALVEDEAAFNAVLQDDPALVASPHLVLDALPATGVAARDFQPVLALLGPRGAPGVPPTGQGLVLEREGTGFRLHGVGFDGPAYHGGLDAAGVMRLVPQQPLGSFAGYAPCESLGGQSVMVILRTTQRDLRRHWRGEGLSLWQLGGDGVFEFMDCPGAVPVETRWIALWASPELARSRIHDAPAWLAGRHALPLFCGVLYPHDLGVEACGQADHLLARDGTGVADPDGAKPMPLRWGRDAIGAIRLDYGQDRVSRLWLVDAGDGVTQAVAWVAAAEVVGYHGTGSGFATWIIGGQDAAPGKAPPAAAPRYRGTQTGR